MEKVRGIFCLNSKCKNYFEDNCMLILKKDMLRISESGTCKDFQKGKNIDYSNNEKLRI